MLSLRRAWPDAPTPWIDLSTGINPYAYPLPPAAPEWLHRLPDAEETTAAQRAAAHYYGVSPEQVALGAGMQPLMFALAMLRLKEHGSSTVAIPTPTYGEYARIWRMAGHEVRETDAAAEVTLLCNPNNPDGRIHATLPETEWLIIDEAFADAQPDISARLADSRIILRSCGKFFGLAGMRASAALTPEPIAAWLRAAIGPWPLSTHACNILPTVLGDTQWIADMRARLERESAAWRATLAQHFSILGHTPLFTLVETPDATTWHARLAAHGIAVRAFDEHPRWLRFGLPDAAHIARIKGALA